MGRVFRKYSEALFLLNQKMGMVFCKKWVGFIYMKTTYGTDSTTYSESSFSRTRRHSYGT